MAQFNPLEIRSTFRGGKRRYYSYDGELYADTFPEEWAKSPAPGTGPKYCENCCFYGSWNGVFIGYCSTCARDEYDGSRGNGFISPGEESTDSAKDSAGDNTYTGAFTTYLYGVNLHDVGDRKICDSYRNIIYAHLANFTHYDPLAVMSGLNNMRENLYNMNREYVHYSMDESDEVSVLTEVDETVGEAVQTEVDETVGEAAQTEALDKTVYCLVCENTKYNCECDYTNEDICSHCGDTTYNCMNSGDDNVEYLDDMLKRYKYDLERG